MDAFGDSKYIKAIVTGDRETLESMRKDANDPTLTEGDVIFCNTHYALVCRIHNEPSRQALHTDMGIRYRPYPKEVN